MTFEKRRRLEQLTVSTEAVQRLEVHSEALIKLSFSGQIDP